MQRGRNDILRSRTEVLPFGSAIWNLSTAPVPLWGPIGIGRPKPFPSPRPSSSSPRLTNRSLGRKRKAPAPIPPPHTHWDFAFLIYVRTASALAKKRSALLKKKGRAGCLWAPSAASACWTPTPVSREGAGLCFPSGRPVAAENELGWAPRGSRFLVLRASHSLIEARVHAGPGTGKAQRSRREHWAMGGWGRLRPWVGPHHRLKSFHGRRRAGQRPRCRTGTRTEASRWREDKARGVRLHRRALLYRGASVLQLALWSQLKNGCALLARNGFQALLIGLCRERKGIASLLLRSSLPSHPCLAFHLWSWMQWRILRNAPECSPSLHKTLFLFPPRVRERREERKEFISSFMWTALSCIERFFALYTTLRKTSLLCTVPFTSKGGSSLWCYGRLSEVQGANSDSDRILRARPFGCHILAEFTSGPYVTRP